MEYGTARKTARTYGKANKSVFVHDLFDYRTSREDAQEEVVPTASSTSHSTFQAKGNTEDTITTHNVSHNKLKHRAHTSSSTLDRRENLHLPEPVVKKTAIFEIESSDESAVKSNSSSRNPKEKQSLKTRPKTKPQVAPQKSASEPTTLSTPSTSTATATATTKFGKLGAKQKYTNQKSATEAKEKIATAAQARTALETTENTNSRRLMYRQDHVPQKSLPRLRRSPSPQTPIVKRKEDVAIVDQSTDVSECPSDHSRYSTMSAGVGAKRRKLSPKDTNSGASSPGQLTLSSLKLNSATLSPPAPSTTFKPERRMSQMKPRRRLIDRLDAPMEDVKQLSEQSSSDNESVAASDKPARADNITPVENLPVNMKGDSMTIPMQEETKPTQNRAIWATRPKTTYATQRSHLSDMIDGLDTPQPDFSQKSTDELQQLPILAQSSQLELEEDETDNDVGPGKLKSIHELRQSGANRRFDREVDALLEDIDPAGSSSKALRLQAIMKLIKRLEDAPFLRQFINSGRSSRLTALTAKRMDMATSMLFMVVLLRLIKSEDTSLDILCQTFKATTDLFPAMLTENRSMSKICKDRKENLSKAMAQDMVEFENTLMLERKSVSAVRSVCPDVLALECLDESMRKLVQMDQTSARLSTSVYIELLDKLNTQSQALQGGDADEGVMLRVKLLLSLLELCSVVVEDADLHVSDRKYQNLGNSLAVIIRTEGQEASSIEQSILRVVVSLSNDKPRMCNLLSHSGISDAAFAIITDHFLSLSKQADDEQQLDQDKLNAVVLALGCLLNFAEGDPNFRASLSQKRSGSDNHIGKLVLIFNSRVSMVDEAVTQEQSQVLVAFGYMSMLLCTLCLNGSVRKQVTQLLRKKSFEDLCSAAETFFRHLRTLEVISEDDTSTSAFVARFSSILETVRAPALET